MILRKTIGLTLAAALLVVACKNEDASEDKLKFSSGEFSSEGKTLKLNNANLYLVEEGAFEDTYTTKKYVITDGTYSDEDFLNATYFIEVLLAVPIGETEFNAGEYDQWFWFADAPPTGKVSYVHISAALENEDTKYYSFETIDDMGSDHDPIVVSGGFENGQTITLAFNGTLNYYHFSSTVNDWIYKHVAGRFSVTANIQAEILSNSLTLKNKL